MNTLICDLDGTLFNDEHRIQFLKNAYKTKKVQDFDQYHKRHTEDIVRRTVFDYVVNGNWAKIVFLTGRPERFRQTTTKQLKELFDKQKIPFRLQMRGNADTSRSAAFKTSVIHANNFHTEWGNVYFVDNCSIVREAIETNFTAYGFVVMDEDLVRHKKHSYEGPMTCPILLKPQKYSDVFEELAETFKQRNAIYGNNWERAEAVMKALFDGEKPTVENFAKWDILQQIVSKLTRFTHSDLTHEDSIKDLAVYAAIMLEIVREEK